MCICAAVRAEGQLTWHITRTKTWETVQIDWWKVKCRAPVQEQNLPKAIFTISEYFENCTTTAVTTFHFLKVTWLLLWKSKHEEEVSVSFLQSEFEAGLYPSQADNNHWLYTHTGACLPFWMTGVDSRFNFCTLSPLRWPGFETDACDLKTVSCNPASVYPLWPCADCRKPRNMEIRLFVH